MRITSLLATSALLLVGLAGCLDGGDTDDEPAAPPRPTITVPRFLEPTAMAMQAGGAEPNLDVAPDGTIWVTAPTGLQFKPNVAQGAAYLWRSADDGATWETLRSPIATGVDPTGSGELGPFCSCDADVAVGDDGTVYFTDWWSIGITPGNYLVEFSSDGGDSWTPSPVPILPHKSVLMDRQWLLPLSDGRIGLFHAELFPAEPRSIEATFSADGGLTWSLPVDVVDEGLNLIGHPMELTDGTILAPWAEIEQGSSDLWTAPGQAMVARSTDGGATWEQHLVSPVPGGYGNLWPIQGAADQAGNAYVAWGAWDHDAGDEERERMAMFLSKSSDGGVTWSDPAKLRARGVNALPWVAATGNGTVAVGWYGGDTEGDPLEAPDDATWYAYAAESLDGGETFALTKVDPEPVKTGPFCPIGGACPSDRELLDYVSLDYAPDGRLWYAYAKEEAKDGFLDAGVYVTVSQKGWDERVFVG
ncbi:MAG: sialidase family protein [Thermoplasmatota archaeon]